MLHEFGLQISLKAHSHDIRTLEDVMVCFIHWRMLRYGFICMGDGPSANNIPTEILPLNMGWDGDLRGYFLKYQVRKRQYLLSINMDGAGDGNSAEVGLLSDARVTKILVDVTDLVWKDLQINRETAEDIAFRIDTDLIQAQGFKRVDEKWLTNWDEQYDLLQLQKELGGPGVLAAADGAQGAARADADNAGTGGQDQQTAPCRPVRRKCSVADIVADSFGANNVGC